MASKQQIQFWGKLMRKRGATRSPLDERGSPFLNAVKEHPESFELFVEYLRAATYPDVERDPQMERDADRILGLRQVQTGVRTIVSL
eukprot:Skav208861  [mRNA]  locus=scaffold4276:71177:71437:+ [translate_table: standard]